MACALTSHRVLDCIDSNGGIQQILVSEQANKPTGVNYAETAGVVTTYTSAANFYQYDLPEQTGSFEQTDMMNVENGTLYYEKKMTFVWNKLNSTDRNELLLLLQNRLQVIVLDRNGIYWLLGYANGMRLDTGTSSSGVAFGDRSGYEKTFVAREPAPIIEINSGLIAALIAP